MKKVIILFIVLLTVFIAGCGEEEKQPEIIEEKVEEEAQQETIVEETLNEIKFNSNLDSFEQEWLTYLEDKNPNSKIYHVKTKDINCEDCYEVYYKKDLSMIKIKVLNGDKTQETAIVDGLFTEIENSEVCSLYGGNWNTCPRICPTDEEVCVTACGDPACEIDQTIVEYKKVGEQCGSDKGDCEFGFTCSFDTREDKYGICE